MPKTFGLPPCAGELHACRDAVAELQGMVANIFMTLMPSLAARKKMRLSGVSQPLLRNASVWYFWRDDVPGVFALQLGEADLHAPAPGVRPGARGRFWIKYYPSLSDDDAFDGLSLQEQALRLGPLFDATGAPVLETWGQLPEAAFHVGYLELEIQEEARLIRLECMARTRWQSRSPAPVDVEHNGVTVRLLDAGDVDRNLPGWALAWPMLDTLTTALGLFYAVAPVGGLLWESAAGEQPSTPDEAPSEHRLVLYLPYLLREPAEHQPALWDVFGVLQPELDACEAAGGQPQWLLVQPPETLLPWLNPLWWQTSTDQDLSDAGLCCLIGHEAEPGGSVTQRSPA